jgi:polysaccharide export outer membrane protein
MRTFLLILAVILGLSSCTINKNLMFKTHTDFVFDVAQDSTNGDYQISANDVLLFRLFTNKGARLLETTTGEDSRFLSLNDIFYTVESDGTVELPEIGIMKVSGLTAYELQGILEDRYEALYNGPYAIVQVMNNRIMVFPGSGARAIVVPLVNRNTTLLEAIALAGGIDERGDASKIKLIRRGNGRYQVYKINLATIEGIDDANMVVQANDIVYVEPVPEIATEVFRDLSPFISLVSGLALIYAIIFRNI